MSITLTEKMEATRASLNLIATNLTIISERVSNLIEKMENYNREIIELNAKIEKLKDEVHEMKFAALRTELKTQDNFGIWKVVGHYAGQFMMAGFWILVALVLFHYGIGLPPIKP